MPLTIRHFRDQHDRLLILADTLMQVIKKRNLEAHPSEARAALGQLSSHLYQHLHAEDRGLYEEMKKSRDPMVKDTAERFAHEMGGLQKAFADYENRWTAPMIRSEPRQFEAETIAITKALQQRIDTENSILYPLAENLSISASENVAEALGGQTPVIHVIDDNPGDFILLVEAWRETGVKGHFTHFPVAAAYLDRIGQIPIPDLVIVDINMPILSGSDLVLKIRASPVLRHAQIVMCSSSANPRDADTAQACGANGFFPKPVTFAEYIPFVKCMNDLIEFYRAAELGNLISPRSIR